MITVLIWGLLLGVSLADSKLNEFIRHFEPLSYNRNEVHENHLRVSRSINQDPFIHINFHAHGRHFNLRLRPDASAFSPNLKVDVSSTSVDEIDLSHIYKGHLQGEQNSEVFGSIRNGIFDGKIYSSTGVYYIERAERYFKDNRLGFHSVIYNDNDVIDKYANKRAACGMNKNVLEWMENIQQSVLIDKRTKTNEKINKILDEYEDESVVGDSSKNLNKYLKKFNTDDTNSDISTHSRKKRATADLMGNKKVCSLYIQTDTLLWKHFHETEKDNDKTKKEITSLISQHVHVVNYIFQNTAFGPFKGISFVVQRITINDTSACDSDAKKNSNPFCNENIDVSNFLNLNSQMNHSDFCLAYVFTYRDFNGGTVGLAWVAQPEVYAGGICEKYRITQLPSGERVMRSLNTGIITFLNYNYPLPPKVSQLTLAHEIGHNFGSPHDFPEQCTPGGSEGNYIMFAKATSGELPNNNKFSECSINNITKVLESLVKQEHLKFCFEEFNGAFCGNKLVESGEECDCGFDEAECQDKCCFPKTSKFPCKLRPGKTCSPSQGPCCTNECTYEAKSKTCRLSSDCRKESSCTGDNATCPESAPKDDLNDCNQNTKVCLNGECIGSVCLKYGMEECFLSKDKEGSLRKPCEVACKSKGNSSTCQSTFDMGKNIAGVLQRPGTPCDNYKGYCDVFQKCRPVDSESPLSRLKNLFNENTLLSVKKWVSAYWWAVVLMGLGFILVMGTFIRCCSVNTPSKNPNKPRVRTLSEAIRSQRPRKRQMGNRHNHRDVPRNQELFFVNHNSVEPSCPASIEDNGHQMWMRDGPQPDPTSNYHKPPFSKDMHRY